MERIPGYAVVFTYNFDNDSEITLFADYNKAKQYLKDAFDEELRIETEENEWEDVETTFDPSGHYAEIRHYVSDGVDICEYRLCTDIREL